jgi:hypothetical protein
MENWFSTTLSSACGATDTTLDVSAVPAPTEGYLVLDPNNTSKREVVHYTSTGSGTVILAGTGNRGLDGTSAQGHAQGVTVVMNYTTSNYKNVGNFTVGGTLNALGDVQVQGNPVWQYLGYAQTTSNQASSGTSATATALTVNVTVPTGATKVRVKVFCRDITCIANAIISIWSGATSAALTNNLAASLNVGVTVGGVCEYVTPSAPSAGSIWYTAAVQTSNGSDTATMEAGATYPAFILVECC